jgi:hypothetical protein
MNLRFCFAAFACVCTASCAVLNPYVGSARIEQNWAEKGRSADEQAEYKKSVLALSKSLQQELQSSAAQLSAYSTTSTITLAGLLGFGGYKGVTDGGSHQIAALAAGGGAVYGAKAALYSPTREQIYNDGVSALVCLDGIYSRFDIAKGKALAAGARKNQSVWERYRDRYYSALVMAESFEKQYYARVISVPSQVNVLLGDVQPDAQTSYALLSSAISTQLKPSAQPTKTEQVRAADDKLYVRYVLDLSAPDPKDVFPDLEAWVVGVQALAEEVKKLDTNQCQVSPSQAPKIVRPSEDNPVKASVGSTTLFPVQNTSGSVSASVQEQDQADAGAAKVKIVSDKGTYSLEVDAVRATSKPVWVSVTDYGKGQLSSGFWLEIK